MKDSERTSPLFVAVGHHGLRLLSEDGSEWKHAQMTKEGDVYRFVRYGNGRFVTLGTYGGHNLFASSANAREWQSGSRDAKYAKFFTGLAYGNQQFLALGGDATSVGHAAPYVLSSEDGHAWSEPVEIGGGFVLRRAAFGNERWVGIGDRGRRSTSADGKAWKDVVPPKREKNTGSYALIDIAYGNGVFVGVGMHGLRMTTEDGVTWSAPEYGEEGEHLNTVLFTGEQFVAVGAGATYFSRNGQKWDRAANTQAPLTAAYGNGTYVGAHWRGRLFVSTDAVEWKFMHRAEHHVESVCFGLC